MPSPRIPRHLASGPGKQRNVEGDRTHVHVARRIRRRPRRWCGRSVRLVRVFGGRRVPHRREVRRGPRRRHHRAAAQRRPPRPTPCRYRGGPSRFWSSTLRPTHQHTGGPGQSRGHRRRRRDPPALPGTQGTAPSGVSTQPGRRQGRGPGGKQGGVAGRGSGEGLPGPLRGKVPNQVASGRCNPDRPPNWWPVPQSGPPATRRLGNQPPIRGSIPHSPDPSGLVGEFATAESLDRPCRRPVPPGSRPRPAGHRPPALSLPRATPSTRPRRRPR